MNFRNQLEMIGNKRWQMASLKRRLAFIIGTSLFVVAGAWSCLANPAKILSIQGIATWDKGGTGSWQSARASQVLSTGDKVRSGPKSRVMIQFSDLSVKRLFADSTMTIDAPAEGSKASSFQLDVGKVLFKSWEKPRDIKFRTKTVSGTIRGTEFHLRVDANGETLLTLFDGAVDLENQFGQLSLTSGEEAIVEVGQPPRKTPAIYAWNVIQWCLYYPGTIDIDELPLTDVERTQLAASLDHWRAGDLLNALDTWPAARIPQSNAEKIYYAALLLSVGGVEDAVGILDGIPAPAGDRVERLSNALRTVIAAVKFENLPVPDSPQLASEFLALSYLYQSQRKLDEALTAAREAIGKSPAFGYAHARVAELEFSFGRTSLSRNALTRAIELSPRNAQAVALQGFLHAAKGNSTDATASFNQAIELDGALGNAWLGRGLVRFQQGNVTEGLADLKATAALEPNRALLRSYLGKGFETDGDLDHALEELGIAKKLDPGDPTAWLYSSLIRRQGNRINQSVRDLEKSIALNDNRALFRSRMLLDQDRAIRGANLASVYRDANMTDIAVREASKAVSSDFGNHSAHLFLANSYADLQQARQSDLRFETPALNELLLANLLAPPGAGVLSPSISQQEYSRLFESDYQSIYSDTEYFSAGDWSQTVSLSGVQGGTGYSLDYSRNAQTGQQRNGDLERNSYSAQVKQRLSERDSLFVQAIYAETRTGDLTPYYNPASAKPNLRLKEIQQPTILAGWHRQWTPGNHTLLFLGRVQDDLNFSDPLYPQLLLGRTGAGAIFATGKPAPPFSTLNYRTDFTLFTSELLQIIDLEPHTLIAGARFQAGEFDTDSALGASTAVLLGDETGAFFPPFPPVTFATPATNQVQSPSLNRVSLYAYDKWKLLDKLQLNLGVAYDRLEIPDNHLIPPVLPTQRERESVSPKAGFVWTPRDRSTVRFAYARAMGGVSFDQSFRLEPSEVAGFNQSFRSIIPESVAGTTANPVYDIYGVSFEQKLSKGTYLTISGNLLNSDVTRRIGSFNQVLGAATPSSVLEQLQYEERSLLLTLNQLFGDYWHAGVRYEWSDASLRDDFPEIPSTVLAAAHTLREATLHRTGLHLGIAHPSGFFARMEADWYLQSNRGSGAAAIPGDSFWQGNLHAGWRFRRRRAEIRFSLLNVADRDYRLNPLNFYAALPRERTFSASLKLNF